MKEIKKAIEMSKATVKILEYIQEDVEYTKRRIEVNKEKIEETDHTDEFTIKILLEEIERDEMYIQALEEIAKKVNK